MPKYIERDAALALPFANGKYDHEHANEHFIYGCETYKEYLENIPEADVVDGAAYRELLHAARLMHEWIFLHSADEEAAYTECGLTAEMNKLLGYGGMVVIELPTEESMVDDG